MISQFEQTARESPHDTFFYFAEEDGTCAPYTYEQVRVASASLAAQLRRNGAARGTYIALDMQNCPAFVYAVLAAAYGGFALVLLNHRLTDDEKEERLADLRMIGGIEVPLVLTEHVVADMVSPVLRDGYPHTTSSVTHSVSSAQRVQAARMTPATDNATTTQRKGFWQRRKNRKEEKRQQGTSASGNRRDQMVSEAIHFAEGSRAKFSLKERALALFTSGTTGRPKAASLTWANLCGAAEASNSALSSYREGIWQAVLPLYHIGGFQIIVRSVLNAIPFALYRRFDAMRVLDDACALRATHISVVDKMLQDMLSAAEDYGSATSQESPQETSQEPLQASSQESSLATSQESPQDALPENPLEAYRCILLGGAAANPATLRRAVAAKARVYASYGMTETSSHIASHLVSEGFDGGLALLSGYEVRIADPNEDGVGQLAIKGPGVFEGYLNARIATTADGFFLTGDSASFSQRKLKVRERSEDMFVSGGENIYPREIETKLLRVPNVADAYVFGVADKQWGRRPVACIERAGDDKTSLQTFAASVQDSIEESLSKLYQPKHVCAFDTIPRTGIGKIDRKATRTRYENRLQVESVTLYRISQDLVRPFSNSKVSMRTRESIIAEVCDHEGRTGLGECVAFSTAWYLPETLGADLRIMEDHLIPMLLGQIYLHPSEVSAAFDECAPAEAFPLAKGALEPALWDLYGKIVDKPLYRLIGGEEPDTPATSPLLKAAGVQGTSGVFAGATLGIMSLDETLKEAAACVEAGYTRLKMKVRPGDDIARVRAVREAYPDITITLDANQSYTETDIAALKVLDGLGVYLIEEPYDPRRTPRKGPTDLLDRLAALQNELTALVCLDESIVCAADAERALAMPGIRCFSLKIAKMGGVGGALDFYRRAKAAGKQVWMGGMFETSVSKRLHAAFETLPGIDIPGDISETGRYFTGDITKPPFEVRGGIIALGGKDAPPGIGCELDLDAIEKVLVERLIYSRA